MKGSVAGKKEGDIEHNNKVIYSSNSNITLRYSDNELQEFREIINNRIEIARKELKYLQHQLRGKDDGGDGSIERHSSADDGSDTTELEQVSQLAARQIMLIKNLENALLR